MNSRLEINGDVCGQVALSIINAYFGGWEAFRNKSAAELRADLARLRPSLKATRHAFLSHPSVAVFIAAFSVVAAVVLTADVIRPWLVVIPRPAAIAFLVTLFGAVAGSSVWMSRSRKPIFDGLELLRAYESRIEALLAIREAERNAGIEVMCKE